MKFLNDHECEALSGGGSSLVLPSIGLNIVTPLNLGVALGLFDATASVLQGNDASTTNMFAQLLKGTIKI
jgi:hypothetical protein